MKRGILLGTRSDILKMCPVTRPCEKKFFFQTIQEKEEKTVIRTWNLVVIVEKRLKEKEDGGGMCKNTLTTLFFESRIGCIREKLGGM